MRVIPNYKVDRSRRCLDVLCFPEVLCENKYNAYMTLVR